MATTESITAAEEWRPIPGFEGLYDVSNIGRVRSYKRGPPGRILRAAINPSTRYFCFSIVRLREKRRTRPVHVLVAAAFLGQRPRGYQVNHISGDRQDNRPENLEYLTPSENQLHACRVLGSRRGKVKLTDDQVREIRTLAGTMVQREIGRRFGVMGSYVSEILSGKKRARVQ